MTHKACPCIVQNNRILAFKHPFAGFQIPKGTVEPNESVEGAVLRELEEESGIQTGVIVEKIGKMDWEIEAGATTFVKSERQRWHLYLVNPGLQLPDAWQHTATGSKMEEGLVFEYFWQPFIDIPDNFHPVYHQAIKMVATFIQHLLDKK